LMFMANRTFLSPDIWLGVHVRRPASCGV